MKYKNKPSGIFRSRLERSVSEIMEEAGVEYEYEKTVFTLLPAFVYKGAKIRPITYKPDFMDLQASKWLIEVKGLETPEFKIKWKMLKHQLQDRNDPLTLYLVKTVKQAREVINEIKIGEQGKRVLREPKAVKLKNSKTRKPKVIQEVQA